MGARGRDLELALRIRTDVGQAVQDLKSYQSTLADIGTAGKRAGDALASVDAKPLSEAAKSAETASRGIEQTGESAETAAQRIRDMVAASVEHRRALTAQLAAELAAADASRATAGVSAERAAEIERVNQAAYESQAAASAQMQSIGELNERIERGARSFEDLAETEAMIDRQMQAGLLTQQEQLVMFEALDKQEKQLIATQAQEEKQAQALLRAYDPASAALNKLAEDERKLKAAVDAGRISREQYNRAMVGISASRQQWEQVSQGVDRAGRSMLQLGVRATEVRTSLAAVARSLAAGDIGGAGNALVTLGSRAATGFGAAGLAIGGVTAALTLFTVAAFKGYRESQELTRTLIATGGATGVTESGVNSMSQSIDDAVGSIGKGRQALLGLISTGEASAETLDQAGLAAVALSELTGRSVEDTTREVSRLMQEPSRVAAELNKQYHFLTAEVFEVITALERQGDTTEAARLATEAFGNTMRDRLVEVNGRLGTLERSWLSVQLGAKRAWDAMLDIGRTETLTDKIADVQREIAQLDLVRRNKLAGGDAIGAEALIADIQRLQDEFKRLNIELAKEQSAAAQKAQDQQLESNAIAAQARQQAALGQDRAIAKAQALKKLEEDMAAIRTEAAKNNRPAMVGDLGIDEAERQLRKQIEERFQQRERKDPDADREAQERERFVQQLERQAALIGLNREQTLQYELAERKLTGTLRERAEAAAAAIAESQKNEQAKRDVEQLAEIQVQYLRAIGDSSAAAELELEQRYDELLARLIAKGDEAGVKIIQKLFAAERARSQLDQIQNELGRFTEDISREEQRINIARENGLISSVEAQRRLLTLRQQEIAFLQQQIPLLEQQQALLGDPQIAAQLDTLKLKLFDLQAQASELQIAFRDSFEGGLANSLRGLADRTLTLRDALTGLLRDTVQGLADVAAQQLASIATAQLMKTIFGQSGTAPNLQAPDPAQAAAAGAAYAAPIAAAAIALTTSGGVLTTAAAALSAAATQLTIANSMSAFAEGGYTGSGGKYQPAGIVHAGEYVQPQRVVQEPGALHFMEDFRRMGMRALDNWRGYAGGGLVVDGPSLTSQARGLVPATAGGAGERSSSSMVLGLEDGLVLKHLMMSKGVEAMIHNISRNPGRFRSALGV